MKVRVVQDGDSFKLEGPDKKVPKVVTEEAKTNPSLLYVDKFNTTLTPEEETNFWNWATKQYGKEDEVYRQMGDYDLKGAWRDLKLDKVEGHLPDTYKKPNHITFSSDSRYSSNEYPAGTWSEKDSGWVYIPSKYTVNLHGAQRLQDYFKQREPNAKLILQ